MGLLYAGRFLHYFRSTRIPLIGLAAFLLGVAPAAAQTTALYLESEPGDYVGGGTAQAFPAAPLTVVGDANAIQVKAFLTDPHLPDVQLAFVALDRPLQRGVYEDVGLAGRAPIGLNVSGWSRGCNTVTGRFTILELERANDGSLARFAADFEQHCEGRDPALVGAVRYNSGVASLIPFSGAYPLYQLSVTPPEHARITGPGIDCGAGSTACTTTVTSVQEVALTVLAEPGWMFSEWTGRCEGYLATVTVRVNTTLTCGATIVADLGGTTSLFLDWNPRWFGEPPPISLSLPGARFTASRLGNAVTVAVGSLTFSLPTLAVTASGGDRVLTTGTYFTTASSSSSRTLPTLRVMGDQSCDGIGRLVVRELVFGVGGEVLRFAADFDCATRVERVLWGAVRFHSTIAGVLPFDGDYPAFRLTVDPPAQGVISGPGLTCGNGSMSCSMLSPSPVVVPLSAAPSPGYVFAGWTGACAGGSDTTVLVAGTRVCGATFVPATASKSLLIWRSVGDSLVADGSSGADSPATSAWTVTGGNDARDLAFTVENLHHELSLRFQSSSPLAAGSYLIGSDIPGFAGLSLSIGSATCQATGRFRVLEAVKGPEGRIDRFAADFELHCPGLTGAIFGAVRFNSPLPVEPLTFSPQPGVSLVIGVPSHGRVIGPALDCRPDSVSCILPSTSPTTVALTAIPDPGYLFVGWTGECSGKAETTVVIVRHQSCAALFEPAAGVPSRTAFFWTSDAAALASPHGGDLFSPANSRWTLWPTGNRRQVSLSIENVDGSYSLDLAAAEGTTLAVGSYGEARIAPWTRGNGLSFGRLSVACTALTGRFLIHEIVWNADDTVSRLAADFEYHCSDATPGFYGAVRLNSTVLDIRPFAGDYPRYSLMLDRPAHGRIVGPGLDCGTATAVCAVAWPNASTAYLRASPDAGYFFTGWTGDCRGAEATALAVNSVRRCGALFSPDGDLPRTLFVVNGTPGAPLATGRELYADGNSLWAVEMLASGAIQVGIWSTTPTDYTDWRMRFSRPGGGLPFPGRYDAAEALQIARDSRACGGSSTSGTVTVHELVLGETGVESLAVDFDLRCPSTSAALRGLLRYRSSQRIVDLATDRSTLQFVATSNGATVLLQPRPQTLRLLQSGPGAVHWTAQSDAAWLSVTPAAGVGPALLAVTAVLPGMDARVGTELTGRLTFTLTGAASATLSVDVTLRVLHALATSFPFGRIDSPTENGGEVSGAIPFTGWALDDVGVEEVTLCRDAVYGEAAAPAAACGGQSQLFVGRATFIEGARPDVADYYAHLPASDVAGWGFMVLTNMLPGQGNGRFRFSAYARDREGQVTALGERTLDVRNATATRPFGTIDTPGQGETISGSAYASFGWALTPGTKAIDPDGSGLMVYVDGEAVGPPSYNHYRSDIAEAFPGMANSNGAVGYRVIDTTTLTDGLHTIVWTATDSDGVTEGLGSRFFRVFNGAGTTMAATVARPGEMAVTAAGHAGTSADDRSPLPWRRGWSPDAPWQAGKSDGTRVVVRGEEVDRFELLTGATEGYLRAGAALQPLPPGSKLDRASGRFTWAPGPGFLGTYDLLFVNGQAGLWRDVRVVIAPKSSGARGPQVVIDTPRAQQDVPQPFHLGGWAIDGDAVAGTGIGTLHVWAYPLTGAPPIFLGTATCGGSRPDVAAIHGERFEASGFGLTVQGLEPGNYDLAVFPWSEVTGGFGAATVVRITVR